MLIQAALLLSLTASASNLNAKAAKAGRESVRRSPPAPFTAPNPSTCRPLSRDGPFSPKHQFFTSSSLPLLYRKPSDSFKSSYPKTQAVIMGRENVHSGRKTPYHGLETSGKTVTLKLF